jgi:Asp-tRNA(Asn)/Glu-tRNA(Gln) amidotransferase A subunit family amidase
MSVATVTELWRTGATELARAEAYPSRDAPVVERLKAAGAIPIGLTNSFEAGTDLDDGRVAETIRSMRMATAVNALGLPAAALPVGIGDGLPQAVQVIGPRFREDLCLDAAAALEDRVGAITPIDPRWR